MKDIFKDTWTVLEKKERKQFVMLSTLDIIISVIDILSLVLLLWIIKFYIQPGQNNLSFLPGWLKNQNSISFIGIFFLLFGIKNISAFLITKAQYKFIGSVAVRISRNNLLNYQQGSFEDFINIDSSVHIRKISLQPFEFCQFILSGIQQIITQSFLIILTIAAIILFNAKLFLLLLVILLPPVFIVFYILKKRLTAAKAQIRSSNERSYQHLLDALKGYVEANIYDRNEFFMNRFIKQRRQFSNYLFESLALQNMPSRIIEIFAILGLFILIAIAKWSGNNDSASLITVGAFMAAAYKIIPGIVKLINTTGQIRAYEYSITDVMPKKKTEIRNENRSDIGIQSIQLKDICFHYKELSVLDNFNLMLHKGDFLGITGESGKGKTTILNLLLGFLTPAKGEILVNDSAVDNESIKKYWPSIAYVRQQSFLIHDTVLRNITLEEEKYTETNLAFALDAAEINRFIENFPERLDKIITENGKNISGGQQQRIALARAVYKNADLILLDEPFNELDETSSTLLLKHFTDLSKKGKIIIMITHDKQSLGYCTKIISLDEQ
ncbi:MAG: ATP-binding cassette domain-containing protein [Chitinophagales bacterium]